jgi:hypothetical protein
MKWSMICAGETTYFIARSRITVQRVRVDCYHAGRIPSGGRREHPLIAELKKFYLVHGMSDCGQKGIGKFEDGKVREAANRLNYNKY